VTKAKKAEAVPVTVRAIVQRINRALAKKGEQLRASRGDQARTELGDYYVIDLHRNTLVLYRVNLDALGRKLGVLRPWERVEEGGD
jgi:hypothetical protein